MHAVSLSQSYRHFIPVKSLLLGECVKALEQRYIPGPGGDAQTEIPERLKGDGLVVAVGALEGRLELAHEQVHQVGVISPNVTLPGLHGLLAYTRRTNIIQMILG